jgi:mono/diheme cytochrome c family protein
MRVLVILLEIAIGAVIAGAIFVFLGLYDVAASRQHLAPTFWLMETGLRESVKHHSRDIEPPPLEDEALVRRGLALYRAHCVQCHGAPGVPPEPFALGMRPAPANLAHTARIWSAAQLYWTVKHGIKMSGMPAWEFRLPDEDLWAIVAFTLKLPFYTPAAYQALEAPKAQPAGAAAGEHQPDAERGRSAVLQYACMTCHHIPGVVGPDAPVGPPLAGIGTRTFLAGGLDNTPENMSLWLRSPQKVNPRSAMPDLGVSERDARDIAAYLYTLR